MTEKEITKVLSSMQGETDAPAHRRALRRSLISLHEGSAAAPQTLTHYFVSYFVMKKHYIPAGVIAIAVLAGALALNPGSTAVAQAQEQVNRAFTRAVAISPEMRAQLEAKMKADMLKTLEEAKAAPDLKIMTKEEFQKESPFSISTGPMATIVATPPEWTDAVPVGEVREIKGAKTIAFSHAGTATAAPDPAQGDVTFTVSASAVPPAKFTGVMTAGAMVTGSAGEGFSEPVKYLSYTDPRGNKTVLGLDKDDTPVFKFATINSADIIKLDNGMIGIEGKAIHMIKLEDTQEIR